MPRTSERTRFDLSVWRRLWSFSRPYLGTVRWLVCAAFVTALIDAAMPLLTRQLIDDVAAHGGEISLFGYGLAYLALTVGLALSISTFIRLAGKIKTHVSHDIRQAGFERLQQLSFAYFDKRSSGWLMARMTSDCDRLANVLAWGVLDLVWGSTMLLLIGLVMVCLDLRLGLLVMLVVPVLAWISAYLRKRILASARQVRETNARITAGFNEAIAGVQTTKSFAREADNLTEFGTLTAGMHQASVRNALLSAVYLPLVMTLGSLATGLALVFGGIELGAGVLSVGTLVAFLNYTQRFFDPVTEIAHWFAELQMAQASAERVIGLIDTQPQIVDSAQVRARQPGSDQHKPFSSIELRDVAFAYDPKQPVLQGINLRVQAGQSIALVGPTGGGKSTIVSLLCRFYEPVSGQILFDGRDYRDYPLAWLQAKLGIVLQTPHLFSGSIAENIRYGRLDASDAEVEAAAAAVGADGFVSELEKGYQTEVGEGGVRLSTGQKQLISFARAILADPEILVMDEATSSVDTETEGHIQRALEQVLQRRTSFIIAHRLSTIRQADCILVIDHGRIVEQGSHEELLALRGEYHALYTQQSLREVLIAGAR